MAAAALPSNQGRDHAPNLEMGASFAALADLLADTAHAVAEIAASVEDGRMSPAGARLRVRTHLAGVIGATNASVSD